ncbi:AAA family ATPase [Paraburkholderia nemoris]|uniref:AAA family ATPase n=1 Tax=Paraburkholderia nemoris TaxID=2793076 RepID=UPI0038B6BD01
MAKLSEYRAEPIYIAGLRLLSHCLQGEGSLIRGDERLWTIENLETIHRVFVAAPDVGDRNFIEKFEDQIKPAGPDVCRLAAEILAVYFLFPSNVGETRKKELVGLVLGWGGDTLPKDCILDEALKQGIGSGGQGYNTRRPFEIAFFVEFALAWKRLPEDTRAHAVSNPESFREIVDATSEDASKKQLRHMLLHILFPEYFERIASSDHKRRIAIAFASLLSETATEDIDARLFDIREKLVEVLDTNEIDFYWSPLVEVWSDSSDFNDGMAPTDALRHKKQIVLYGPPGTGKTHLAKELARRLIRSAFLSKLPAKQYFSKAKSGEIDREIEKRVHRLQLHPAYGYEDFVRGLHIGAGGATEYRLGYLPNLIKEVDADDSEIPHVLVLDEINRTDLSRTLGECFSLLEDRDAPIELPGRDSAGTSMTLRIPGNLFVVGTMNLIDQSIEQMDFALRRRFLWVLCSFNAQALLSAAEEKWHRHPCNISWETVEADFVKLAGAATSLNRAIHESPLLGAQYEIGHTYLLDTVAFLRDDMGTRPQTFLWRKDGKAKRPVEQLWELSLRPLVEEYLSGLDAKTCEVEVKRLSATFLSVKPEAA